MTNAEYFDIFEYCFNISTRAKILFLQTDAMFISQHCKIINILFHSLESRSGTLTDWGIIVVWKNTCMCSPKAPYWGAVVLLESMACRNGRAAPEE